MKIAISGATGLVGSHLVAALQGHNIIPLCRSSGIDLTRPQGLAQALEGCDALVHCAGINREIGRQTFDNLHVQATSWLVDAARQVGVRRLILTSYLRARPDCGSRYLESKWQAEQIVRASGLEYTVLKPGLIFGRGDQLIGRLAPVLKLLPLFAHVGLRDPQVRPVDVLDVARVLGAALEGRLANQTIAVLGPEEMPFAEVARRIGQAVGRRVWSLPTPVWVHYVVAALLERVMKTPLVATAQIRMLSEGMVEPLPQGSCGLLPADLEPTLTLTAERIRGCL